MHMPGGLFLFPQRFLMLSDHQATITPHSGTARFKTDPTTSPTRQETPMLTQILDVTPPAWFAKARCQDGVGTLTELFFSEDLGDIARAKAICTNCAVEIGRAHV